MATHNSPASQSNDHPSWEARMRTASDALTVEPREDSWTRVRHQLDTGRIQPISQRPGLASWPFLRIAASICLLAGIWYLFQPARQAPTVTPETLQEAPAYFAGYLQVSQSLEGKPAVPEGSGSARFRDAYAGSPLSGDSAGSL